MKNRVFAWLQVVWLALLVRERHNVFVRKLGEAVLIMDKDYCFGALRPESELYELCANRLSFDHMTKHCCFVCDCDYPKVDLSYKTVKQFMR